MRTHSGLSDRRSSTPHQQKGGPPHANQCRLRSTDPRPPVPRGIPLGWRRCAQSELRDSAGCRASWHTPLRGNQTAYPLRPDSHVPHAASAPVTFTRADDGQTSYAWRYRARARGTSSCPTVSLVSSRPASPEATSEWFVLARRSRTTRVDFRGLGEPAWLAGSSRTITWASTPGVPRLSAGLGSISMRAVSPRRARLPGRIVSLAPPPPHARGAGSVIDVRTGVTHRPGHAPVAVPSSSLESQAGGRGEGAGAMRRSRVGDEPA